MLSLMAAVMSELPTAMLTDKREPTCCRQPLWGLMGCTGSAGVTWASVRPSAAQRSSRNPGQHWSPQLQLLLLPGWPSQDKKPRKGLE